MNDYDNFFLPATDLSAGRAFYEGILGLPVKFDFSKQGMIAFKVGEQEPAIILNAHPESRPTIWFVVDDVPLEADRLRSRGVALLSEPFRIRTGMAVEFDDPFSNRLGITDYSAQSAR